MEEEARAPQGRRLERHPEKQVTVHTSHPTSSDAARKAEPRANQERVRLWASCHPRFLPLQGVLCLFLQTSSLKKITRKDTVMVTGGSGDSTHFMLL